MGHASRINTYAQHRNSTDTTRSLTEQRNHSTSDLEAQSASRTLPLNTNSSSRGWGQEVRNTTAADHDEGGNAKSPTIGVGRATTGVSRGASSLRRRGPLNAPSTAYGALDMGRRIGWTPGQEPGIDTSEPAPPYSEGHSGDQHHRHPESLRQKCEITVVDYSSDEPGMTTRDLDNDNLEEFLNEPMEDWVQVRWINVNGLSWDVIRLLSNHKGFHRLAVEDLMNTRNRTKVDWYADNMYMVLPLQRLVNIEEPVSDSDDDDDVKASTATLDASDAIVKRERLRRKQELQQKKRRKGAIATLLSDLLHPKKRRAKRSDGGQLNAAVKFQKASDMSSPWVPRQVRTLQRYHAGPNIDRTDFMERHAVLAHKGLAVSMEQVSIFLCSDNTVVSFFEYSAHDVQTPIVHRLESSDTILRQSADASMLAQAILDTIIDLAIPVTTAYQDAIGDLELDVLTDPSIKQSTSLYILSSEIAVLRGAIAPIPQLIGSLKDHKYSETTANPRGSRAVTPQMEMPSFINPPGPTPQLLASPTIPPTNNPNTNLDHNPRPIQQRHPSTHPIVPRVQITPLTVTYLGDVEDHALLIQDSYDQMRRSADNLVDLIFNTISATQNESMRQLTIVTCFFLPLSFLTGYFGMNFAQFDAVQSNSDSYFWIIAAPVSVVVFCLLMRDFMMRWLVKLANQALIRRGRRKRLEN